MISTCFWVKQTKMIVFLISKEEHELYLDKIIWLNEMNLENFMGLGSFSGAVIWVISYTHLAARSFSSLSWCFSNSDLTIALKNDFDWYNSTRHVVACCIWINIEGWGGLVITKLKAW